MKTIHKHTLHVDNPETWTIETYSSCKLLHITNQDGYYNNVIIWLEVNTDNPKVKQHFEIVGTGHPIPDHHHHIGSCLAGPFVWHVYSAASI